MPRPSSDEFIAQNDEEIHERRALLVSELDAADAEQRQELRRQKRLHKKLKKKEAKKLTTKSEVQQAIPSTDNDHKQELQSDWIIEYDLNDNTQMSQLTDEIRRSSIATTDEDKTERINTILMKIKKQQEQLRKLRQYVMTMLSDQPSSRSKNRRQNPNVDQNSLMNFINQSTPSGCWLCSGKTFAEAAIQCDHITEQ